MKQEKETYMAPVIEELSIKTEQGFAVSGSGEGFGSGTGAW